MPVAVSPAPPADLTLRAQGGHAHIGSPGVRPDLRHTTLRAALLLGVCALARTRELGEVRVESWGDTPGEVAQDLALGLRVEVEDPILAAD